jgi:NAD(P)-dependent dehydrogenase (short-subunit alcohol dehydrogenase family)
MLLTNKVALITGGAKGMGKGIALKFADEGCDVAIADISLNEANDTIAEVLKKGRKGLAVQCDVTEIDQVKDTVDKVLSAFGKIDILVNNAGGLAGNLTPIEDMTVDLWDRTFALNVRSTFLFCKFIIPHMRQRKYGKILNISSVGAVSPPNHVPNYNSAKAAVTGLTLDLAFTLAPTGINVNAILPGPIRTSFYDRRIGSWNENEKDAFFQGLGAKSVPMGRVGTPEEIAGAALFLCSELGSFVTGETIVVGGGLPLGIFNAH